MLQTKYILKFVIIMVFKLTHTTSPFSTLCSL